MKLLVDDLHVLRIQREGDDQGPIATVWKAVTGTAAELLEAEAPDRQGVRVPVEGSFEQPRFGTFAAIESMLRHAFVQAIRPGFTGLVQSGDVPEGPSAVRHPGFRRGSTRWGFVHPALIALPGAPPVRLRDPSRRGEGRGEGAVMDDLQLASALQAALSPSALPAQRSARERLSPAPARAAGLARGARIPRAPPGA